MSHATRTSCTRRWLAYATPTSRRANERLAAQTCQSRGCGVSPSHARSRFLGCMRNARRARVRRQARLRASRPPSVFASDAQVLAAARRCETDVAGGSSVPALLFLSYRRSPRQAASLHSGAGGPSIPARIRRRGGYGKRQDRSSPSSPARRMRAGLTKSPLCSAIVSG